MSSAKRIEITRKGYDMSYVFPSLKDAAKELGRSQWTVRARLRDGYVLFTDQMVPVHVREVAR